jgi:hypothetical protein
VIATSTRTLVRMQDGGKEQAALMTTRILTVLGALQE